MQCAVVLKKDRKNQGWESIPKKVKKQLIFESSPKSKEILDFDGSLKE